MSATSTRPSSTSPYKGFLVAAAATLGMSVSYIDRQTLAAIAPTVRTALAIDHAQYGWLVSAFSMAYLVGAPATGAIVDRLGSRKGFAVAVVLWSLVAGAHAFATSFAILFALRVLLGMTEAPSFPAAAQSIRRAMPEGRRPVAYGLLFTGSSIGAMIAAPLAIHLEDRYGFRFAFAGVACVAVAWVPVWLLVTREPRGAAAAPSTIYRDQPREATAPPRASFLATGTSAPVLRALVAVVGSAPVMMLSLNFSSQYLVEDWHMAKNAVGGLLVLPPLFFDIGAVGFGFLASRRPLRTHADYILVCAALGACMALAPFAPSPLAAMSLIAAASCGAGGIYVLVTNDMLGRVPLERTSTAGGMTAAAQSLSHVVIGPLAGKVIDHTHSFTAVLVALGLFVVPTSLAFAFWPSLRRA